MDAPSEDFGAGNGGSAAPRFTGTTTWFFLLFDWFWCIPDGPGHSRKVREGPGQKLKKVEKYKTNVKNVGPDFRGSVLGQNVKLTAPLVVTSEFPSVEFVYILS